jgi:SAM-dependent methyltransferase
MTLREEALHAFVGKMLGDLGGAFGTPTTRLGFRLGLYDSLHADGPATADELAARTGLKGRRLVREWALAQAANGFITYEAGEDRFALSPEQAMVFAIKDSPVYMEGAFDLAAAMIDAEPQVEAAFRDGGGVAWGALGGCLFCAVGAFFRPTYVNQIAQAWVPSLEGVETRLKEGAKVADIGCGVGHSTILMAEAWPQSRFVGYDFHEGSIAEANGHAQAHGMGDRVRFETRAAKEIAEDGFDLITMFDCLHDMGDPAGCAEHLASLLKPDGTLMLVEPIASDDVAENVGNPVSRLYYNGSTMICCPTSLAQEVGTALGAQAGEAKLTALLSGAGFRDVRRATETPFNMVLEARH